MKMLSVVRKPPFASLSISFCIIEGLRFVTSFCVKSKIKHSQNNLLFSLQLLNKRSGKKHRSYCNKVKVVLCRPAVRQCNCEQWVHMSHFE